jgi:hypothetical protein
MKMDFRFRATLSPAGPGRASWCVIFRHPVKVGPDGKIGKRVRRGLGTSDRAEAQRLVDQANILLNNDSLWTPAARALAEKRGIDPRIVEAFYDELLPTPRDGWALRERAIPLPSNKDGYARGLLLGPTGAGKTTVDRQLIGTGGRDEKFPSTSTARTTTCDIEIIATPSDTYDAVISFLPKDETRQNIEECVCAAVLSHIEQEPEEVKARRFLEHADQRFRLSYVLGAWRTHTDTDDLPDDVDAQTPNTNDSISHEETASLQQRLQEYVDAIKTLAVASSDHLSRELHVVLHEATKEDRDTFEELLEDHLREHEEFHALVDAVIDDIEARFARIDDGLERDRSSWPSIWRTSVPASQRTRFLRSINRFSSNQAGLFGTLLTPLVDGIRVRGPFTPTWANDVPRVVLMDGEGLGHVASTGSSLSTSITRRYHLADVILLVDSATQPMLGASAAALRSIASSGELSKLVFVFTHLDQVRGDNFGTVADKYQHILASADNIFAALGKELGKGVENTLKRIALQRSFFLSNIDEPVLSTPRTKAERATLHALQQLLVVIREVAQPAPDPGIAPIYEDANLVLCITQAMHEFRDLWHQHLSLAPWQTIKALTRRLGVFGRDEYGDLKPVADFRARLIECIRPFLEEPVEWRPSRGTDELRVRAVEAVAREVANTIESFAKDRVLVAHAAAWLKAYAHRGPGSTLTRGRDVESIYGQAAPIPRGTADAVANAFIREMRKLIRSAIEAGGGKLIGLDEHSELDRSAVLSPEGDL